MRRLTIMAVAVVFVLACQMGAVAAIQLVYENGPNTGQSYFGPVVLKIINYDNGSVYTSLTPGTPYGYSGAPGAGVGGGVTTLDGLAQFPANGALPLGPWPGATTPSNLEDSWGIGRLAEIDDPSGFRLWSPLGKGSEITALFYGEQDYYVIEGPTGEQTIDGVGLTVDFYQHASEIFDPTLGWAARTAGNTYPTVTNGSLVLSARSTSGFLETTANGGSAAEFESRFTYGTLTGTGDSYLDVTGGTAMAQFDSNLITNPNSIANGVPATDLWVHWTTSGTAVDDWLVTSNDPLTAVAVPEPATLIIWVLLGAMGWMGAMVWRRRG